MPDHVFPFAAKPLAQACIPIVDAAQGYPKPPTVFGPGVQGPPASTTTYSGVWSDGSQFGYPADAITTAALTGHVILSSTLPGALFVVVP
jgi:hypothetical protein